MNRQNIWDIKFIAAFLIVYFVMAAEIVKDLSMMGIPNNDGNQSVH